MNIDLIHEIITDFQQSQLPDLIKRDIDFSCPNNKIRVLIGARRAGKTYSFYQLIKELITQGISKEQILFLNFEDERLVPLEAQDLTKILNTFYAMYPTNKDKVVYIFFDEIQAVNQWELFVRRVHENEKVQINLTGSSSKLMSQEIATQLRGRTLSYEVSPFNLAEYLKFKNISRKDRSSKNKSYIINAFNSFLNTGGYPEIVNVSEPMRIKILQDYFNLLIYKDLVERHNIRNYSLVKYFVKYLLANNANPITVNKIFNDLKSQGFKVSKDTMHNYLAYLEDALCVSLVSMYTDSIRKQQIRYKKIFFIDHGLVTSLVNSRSYNYGRLLETMVYNQLRRHYTREQIYYYRTEKNQEIDFLVHDRGKIIMLYQVCDNLDNLNTRKREVSALTQAMYELDVSRAVVITQNESEEVIEKDKSIQVIPYWKWALSVL